MSKFIFVNLLLLKISFALEWRFQNIFYDNKTIANTIFLSLEIENKDQRLEKLKNILDDMTEYQKDILTRTLFWYKEFEKIQKQNDDQVNILDCILLDFIFAFWREEV